jgi:(1->4)-alpha-D-glucan 1-alpha-D-glucosylmutase
MLRPVSATYRIQLNPSYGFTELGEIMGYLRDLGISHIYASPVFKARPGSTHGYDIVDPTELNPELGTREDFNRLIGKLRDAGIGWIQDVVPNHMAFDGTNSMLMDIMENGSFSRYFDYFDIVWHHPDESMALKLLAPFLGKPYGEALESGEISLRYTPEGFVIAYFDLSLPVKIETYPDILGHRLYELKRRVGEEHPDFIQYLGVLYVLRSIPREETDTDERYKQIHYVKKMLHELYKTSEKVRSFIGEIVGEYNGMKEDPASYQLLDTLMQRQNFRLAYWRVANQEINYKRFFNINELISIRIQDPKIFWDTHSLVAELVRTGSIDGVRIDHIDGLYDPEQYLRLLREISGSMYIVVEKILEPDEILPVGWPVQGTTGYDFMNYVNGVFCRKNNQREMTKIYAGFTGLQENFHDLVYRKKRLIIERQLTGDLDNLANLLKRIANKYRHGRDITLHGLRKAMVEILAFFPVYRTYIRGTEINEADKRIITETVMKALSISPEYRVEISFIEKLLLFDFYQELTSDERDECIDFVMKFQRLTGPLMAKGFEDTVLYQYNRLISLNDVGGDPVSFGVSLHQFHTFNQQRAELSPSTMNATATHDMKRGEDVRARINVLSEMPREWKIAVNRWHTINKKHIRIIDEKAVPDPNEEYFIYQTLIGTFPFEYDNASTYLQRIEQYMTKALREAKVHSFWSKPNIVYENTIHSFLRNILTPGKKNLFLHDFVPFQKRIAHYGAVQSLGQAILKLTSPGVPDLYQGTEFWDLSLVDPDNRRPVDYALRARHLREIKSLGPNDVKPYTKSLLKTKSDGRLKLYIISKVLDTRVEYEDLFREGSYLPLRVTGTHKNFIIAYARVLNDNCCICVVPRWVSLLCSETEYPLGESIWQDTAVELPRGIRGRLTDIFTSKNLVSEKSGKLLVSNILSHFPVSLLKSST